MKIDLSWLKLHPKDTEAFHLRETLKDPELLPGISVVDQVAVDLSITNTGRLMVGQGEIEARLELTCDRCLRSFHQDTKVPFTVELCPEENRSYFKNEESFIYFVEPQVDLEPVVRESLILSLPLRTLCSSDCKGLCPSCGKDLNLAPCQCREKEIDPRWEALKKML